MSLERLIDRFVREGILQKPRGRSKNNLIIDCPFIDNPVHGGKIIQNTPSFGIHVESGKWHCFSCKASGKNIMSLYKCLTGRDLPEDIDMGLLEMASRLSSAAEIKDPEPKAPYPLESEPIISLPTEHVAKRYIKKRRIRKWVVEQAGLRWFGGKFLPSMSGKRGHIFGYRVICPISLGNGVLGYSGRALDPTEVRANPKYYRPIKNIGVLLYDPGKICGSKHKDVFVVEGEFDVLRCLSEGIPAVGIFGSNLSEAHALRLSRFRRILLMLDPDPAGRGGMDKAMEDFSKRLPMFRVNLPEGMDPGSMPDGYGVDLLESVKVKSI